MSSSSPAKLTGTTAANNAAEDTIQPVSGATDNIDAGKLKRPPEQAKDVMEQHAQDREPTTDEAAERTLYILEEKRKQLDEEIAAFKAAKDEEFRIFERELCGGHGGPDTKKKARGDTETSGTGEKRHRVSGQSAEASSPPSASTLKAPDTTGSHTNNKHTSGKHRPGDVTPPHEREIEFQGLFTPTYMPLLDSSSYFLPVRQLSAGPPILSSSPSSELTGHESSSSSRPYNVPKYGDLEPSTQQSPTSSPLPNISIPPKVRSASSPTKRPIKLESRRNSAPVSLHSSLRQSSNSGSKSRQAKRVKFKFDDIIVLPNASVDKTIESVTTMGDVFDRDAMAGLTYDLLDKTGSEHEKHSLSPSFKFGRPPSEVEEPEGTSNRTLEGAETSSTTKHAHEKAPSLSQSFELGRTSTGDNPSTDNAMSAKPTQTEVIGSDDGLGEGWSTVKTKDVVEAGRDDSAEVIARAEYEGIDDDLDADIMFDLDETMPEDLEATKLDENDVCKGVASGIENAIVPAESAFFAPGSFRGYDLSLVIPIASSVSDRREARFNSTLPIAAAASVPADLHFGKQRPGAMPSSSRTARQHPDFGNPKLATQGGRFAHTGRVNTTPKKPLWIPEESPDSSPVIRRRNTDKYDVSDDDTHGDGIAISAKRYHYRNGAKAMEDDSDATISPTASSLPIQITASLVVGWFDNGDVERNSYTPEPPNDSTTPKDLREIRAEDAVQNEREGARRSVDTSPNATPADVVPDVPNVPTATNQFTLSAKNYVSSVDNPVTDPFATMTVGGTHRNAYGGASSIGGHRRIMSNPFMSGSLESPRATIMALAGPDLGGYVGSIDGRSGYDVVDRESYLKLRRGSTAGAAQSFSERLMLENEENEAKERAREERNEARRKVT